MSEIPILMRALPAGVLLGAMFYGGLWWTVRRTVSQGKLGIWLIGSFLLRTALAVSGFYFVARNDWRALLVCLLGFLLARIVVTRLTRVPLARKHRLVAGPGL